MALDKTLYTPIAIVGGAGIIGVCLFFALRTNAPAPAASSSAASSSTTALHRDSRPPVDAAAPAVSPTPTPTPPPHPPAAPDSSGARAAVADALEKQKKAVNDKCMGPLDGKPMPARKLFVECTFGPDGKQLMRSVQQDREAGPPWVSECVQRALGTLEIPASGAPVQLVYEWTLP